MPVGPMDPTLQDQDKGSWVQALIAAAQAGTQIYGALSGGSESNSQFIPGVTESDVYSRSRLKLGAETGPESYMAGLQQALFGQGANSLLAGNIPGLNDIAAGKLPAASLQRIDQMAYGGLTPALRRASGVAQEEALTRGIGLSSIQSERTAELHQPLMDAAANRAAGLQMQELDRLSGLRQQSIANAMALQNSPALDRLLQIRLAEAEQQNFTQNREPGGTDFGEGDPAAMAKEKERWNEMLAAATSTAQKYSSHQDRHLKKRKLQELVESFGYTVGPGPSYIIRDERGDQVGDLPSLGLGAGNMPTAEPR